MFAEIDSAGDGVEVDRLARRRRSASGKSHAETIGDALARAPRSTLRRLRDHARRTCFERDLGQLEHERRGEVRLLGVVCERKNSRAWL